MRSKHLNTIISILGLFALFLLVYLSMDKSENLDEPGPALEKKQLELKLVNLADEISVS